MRTLRGFNHVEGFYHGVATQHDQLSAIALHAPSGVLALGSVDGAVPFKPHVALCLSFRADVVKLSFTKLLRPAKLEEQVSLGDLSTDASADVSFSACPGRRPLITVACVDVNDTCH